MRTCRYLREKWKISTLRVLERSSFPPPRLDRVYEKARKRSKRTGNMLLAPACPRARWDSPLRERSGCGATADRGLRACAQVQLSELEAQAQFLALLGESKIGFGFWCGNDDVHVRGDSRFRSRNRRLLCLAGAGSAVLAALLAERALIELEDWCLRQ